MTHRLIWLIALAACGDDPGVPVDAPSEDAPDAGTPRARIGWVDIYEDRFLYEDGTGPMESRRSQVTAQFFQGRPPSFHHQTMAAGACVLREYTPSLCDPACTDGLCVQPDVCEPWPQLISAGRLTVTGLETAVTIDPQSGYYYPPGVLPADLFDDAARVTASLAGADLPAMSLATDAVPALAAAIPNAGITLEPGQDHTIHWTPAGTGRIRVTLNSNNQGHGHPYLAIIECDADDDAGQLTIASALVDAFPETRAWRVCAGSDCPPSTLRRYRRAESPVGADQAVELMVASQISFGVEHRRTPGN